MHLVKNFSVFKHSYIENVLHDRQAGFTNISCSRYFYYGRKKMRSKKREGSIRKRDPHAVRKSFLSTPRRRYVTTNYPAREIPAKICFQNLDANRAQRGAKPVCARLALTILEHFHMESDNRELHGFKNTQFAEPAFKIMQLFFIFFGIIKKQRAEQDIGKCRHGHV